MESNPLDSKKDFGFFFLKYIKTVRKEAFSFRTCPYVCTAARKTVFGLLLVRAANAIYDAIQPVAVEQFDHALVARGGQLGVDGQTRIHGNTQFLGGGLGMAGAENIVHLAAPVSYTHLDMFACFLTGHFLRERFSDICAWGPVRFFSDIGPSLGYERWRPRFSHMRASFQASALLLNAAIFCHRRFF